MVKTFDLVIRKIFERMETATLRIYCEANKTGNG